MQTIRKIVPLILVAAFPLAVLAGNGSAGEKCERTWRGTVTAVNTRENSITVKHAWLTRTFRLGKHCAITTVDKKQAALSDLLRGERVRIRYQNAEGVRVADRIHERALRYDGTVQAVDGKAGTVTMEELALYRPFHAPEKFRIASDCKVKLWDGREGTVAEVQPGDQISVIYNLPGGSPMAYRIRDKSATFAGAVEAIDLPARTIEAKELFGEKKFELGDDCQIILRGEKAGHMKDLVLGQQYQFTYEDVNGVNVLNRIAPAQEGKPAETASTKAGGS